MVWLNQQLLMGNDTAPSAYFMLFEIVGLIRVKVEHALCLGNLMMILET